MTLDKIWENCLAMWKWVVWKLVIGIVTGSRAGVLSLKIQWVEKNNFNNLHSNCFFCDALVSPRSCSNCPGTKVDPNFNCWNPKYSYTNHPIRFYMKLRSLNRKRKRQNRRK